MISNINLKRIASKINELGGFQEGVRNFKVFNEYNIQLIKNKEENEDEISYLTRMKNKYDINDDYFEAVLHNKKFIKNQKSEISSYLLKYPPGCVAMILFGTPTKTDRLKYDLSPGKYIHFSKYKKALYDIWFNNNFDNFEFIIHKYRYYESLYKDKDEDENENLYFQKVYLLDDNTLKNEIGFTDEELSSLNKKRLNDPEAYVRLTKEEKTSIFDSSSYGLETIIRKDDDSRFPMISYNIVRILPSQDKKNDIIKVSEYNMYKSVGFKYVDLNDKKSKNWYNMRMNLPIEYN